MQQVIVNSHTDTYSVADGTSSIVLPNILMPVTLRLHSALPPL